MDERNVLREIDVMTGEPMGVASANVGLAPSLSNDAGEALFVINLCAAMTPINLEAQQVPGLDQYKLYQVSRMEDGRRRYRLRLGFFTTESQAEDVLASVRSRYATAFTSCLCEEDVKFASGYLKRTVQDIQRTGRFAVTKIRRDNGATTTSIPALDTMTLRTLSAAEATGIHVALPKVEKAAVSSNTVDHAPPAPANLQQKAAPRPVAHVATPKAIPASTLSNQSVKSAPPKVAAAVKSQPAAQAVDSASSTQKIAIPVGKTIDTTKPMTIADAIAAMGQTAPPKRASLMRQAQAMAPVDAAERAKAVPNNSMSFDADVVSLDATSTFKAPNFAAADPAKIISKQNLKPVVTKTPTATAASKPVVATPAQTKAAPSALPAKSVAAQKAAAQAIAAPSTKITDAKAQSVAPQKPIVSADWEVSVPPVHASKPSSHTATGAYHVGAGVQIPNVNLTLENSPPVAAAPKQGTAAPTKVAAPIDQGNTNDLLLARELAKQSAMWRQENSDVPNLDTTQTIRTLTKTELEDANRDKWFTVQLAISDQPANLDTMPHLDIFEAYTLYSVATMDSGRIRHALRLGFFREEVSAEAVMGYLRTFFGEPVITRIPDAEHARFANAPKRTAPVKTAATVVTLEEKRPTPIAVPTINTAVERSATMTKSANAAKPAARQAGVATRSTPMASRKPAARNGKENVSSAQQDLLEEARLLGLSDTQMIRVQKNPSLLARLVGKLGK